MSTFLDAAMMVLSPMSVRHVTPIVRPREPYLRRVYRVMADDVMAGMPPFMVHAAQPEILAGLWLVARESWLAAPAGRTAREAVCVGVSQVNRCPFCIEVHTSVLRAGNDTEQACRAWGEATGHQGAPGLARRPFADEHSAQFLGTAFTYHYLNRVAEVLLADSPRPRGIPQKIADLTVGAGLARTRLTPGLHSDLLPDQPLPQDVTWAATNPHVAGGLAKFLAAVDRASDAVPSPVRELVERRTAAWDGSSPGLSRAWLEADVAGLAEEHRPAGRLALSTALAAYQVDDGLVAAHLATRPGDADLVALVSFAASTAARRVLSWC